MTQEDLKQELVSKLHELPSLAYGRLTIDANAPALVLILRGGRVLGVWRCGPEGCDYVPAGSRHVSYSGCSAADAAQITANLFTRRMAA